MQPVTSQCVSRGRNAATRREASDEKHSFKAMLSAAMAEKMNRSSPVTGRCAKRHGQGEWKQSLENDFPGLAGKDAENEKKLDRSFPHPGQAWCAGRPGDISAGEPPVCLGGSVLTPDLTASIVERIQVVQRCAGSAEILLSMRKDVLGGVRVRMRSLKGKVHAEFLADDPACVALIEAELDVLLKALDARGVSVGEVIVRRKK